MTITLPALLRSTLGLVVAGTATIAIITASAAPAQAADTPRSIAIDLRGIDLATPAGEARIAAAVARAARSVCSTSADRGVAASLARRDCIDTAMAQALPRVTQLADAARAARPQLADIPAPTNIVRR